MKSATASVLFFTDLQFKVNRVTSLSSGMAFGILAVSYFFEEFSSFVQKAADSPDDLIITETSISISMIQITQTLALIWKSWMLLFLDGGRR
jgi:hypothetical protein